jgi:RNA polymerase sigma-70 factor (ECF subfamily)
LVEKIWQKRQKKRKWLRLLRSGDHRAFAEFIEKYKETVFLCCRRLGLREDEAEDVASETFLATYKGIGRYRGRAELSTWLWTIAYRQGINYLRKNRKQWQLEAEPGEQVGDSKEQGPAAVVQGREREKIVWEAVERLPRLWAMAVILYYREEKSIVDIAKIMQIKENTVKTYLFRGRDKLKQILATVFTEDIDGGR